MNLYKKSTAEPYSFMVIDTTLLSDYSLRFRNNLLKTTWKLIMITDDKIRDEKLQHYINRKAGKISVLLSGKINKYEYLTGKEILPSDQSRIIEQAKFIHSPLGKVFEKQIKIIEDQGKKTNKDAWKAW